MAALVHLFVAEKTRDRASSTLEIRTTVPCDVPLSEPDILEKLKKKDYAGLFEKFQRRTTKRKKEKEKQITYARPYTIRADME